MRILTHSTKLIYLTAMSLLLICITIFGQDQDKKSKTSKIPDLANGPVDPFKQGNERAKFLKAAGADLEIDESEFKANAKTKDGFVRSFDRWSTLIKFDNRFFCYQVLYDRLNVFYFVER